MMWWGRQGFEGGAFAVFWPKHQLLLDSSLALLQHKKGQKVTNTEQRILL